MKISPVGDARWGKRKQNELGRPAGRRGSGTAQKIDYLLKSWEKCKANGLFRFQGNRIFFMGIKSDRKRHIQETSFRATFAMEFPFVHAYAVTDPAAPRLWQNMLLAAGRDAPAHAPDDPALEAMLMHRLPDPGGAWPPFTDEYAPVDRLIGEL